MKLQPALALSLPPPACLSDNPGNNYTRPLVLYPWHMLTPGESIFFAEERAEHAKRALRSYCYYIFKLGYPRSSTLFNYHHRRVNGVYGLVVTRRKEP